MPRDLDLVLAQTVAYLEARGWVVWREDKIQLTSAGLAIVGGTERVPPPATAALQLAEMKAALDGDIDARASVAIRTMQALLERPLKLPFALGEKHDA